MKGFIPYQYNDGQPDPWEYLPVTGSAAIEVGDAMVVTSGKLALATGTTKPAYICMCDRAATVADEMIPVIRVNDDTVYETELGVAINALAVGAKYTLNTTSDGITATTENGVAEVVGFEGTAIGSKVRVRF